MVLRANILDYVREGLDPKIWETENGNMVLQLEVEEEILDIIFSALDDLDLPAESLQDVFIYGSILSNQWNATTDIDARIVLDPEVVERFYPDTTGDDLFDMVIDKIHGVLLDGTKHPFNATIVIEGEETELGQSQLGITENNPVYDVLDRNVLVAPRLQKEDFDPDMEFEEERDETTKIMEKLDELIRETRADSIDYELIEEAVGEVSNPDLLLEKMEERLEEIEDNIRKLVQEYEDLKKERTKSYSEGEGHYGPGNIKYKYLERYKYLSVLRKLKRLFKGGIEPEEVEDVVKTIS